MFPDGQDCQESRETLLAELRAEYRDSEREKRDCLARLESACKRQARIGRMIALVSGDKSDPPAFPGRVEFAIERRGVHLPPVLANVLIVLAGGPNARGEAAWWSIGAIQAGVAARIKKPVARQSVIQAVHRLRQEFVLAGLPDGLIVSRAGRWKLKVSAISLAGLRQPRSDIG